MRPSRLAGLQYGGDDGVSASCLEAVWRLLQTRHSISDVRILTCGEFHGLLLTLGSGERVAIKAGFASGYSGEGPRTFAMVLQLLRRHGANIDECFVTAGVFERLEASALSVKDIQKIDAAEVTRGMRWTDYIDAYAMLDTPVSSLWAHFEPTLPLSIIDPRLADLALRFFDDPGRVVFEGYRRLEETIRERIGSSEVGARLFSKAFDGENSKLLWPGVQAGVAAGRLLMFKGAYMAYRNPRAHAEVATEASEAVRAFLVLTELFAWEGAAVERGPTIPC